jgi:hypothetical protein
MNMSESSETRQIVIKIMESEQHCVICSNPSADPLSTSVRVPTKEKLTSVWRRIFQYFDFESHSPAMMTEELFGKCLSRQQPFCLSCLDVAEKIAELHDRVIGLEAEIERNVAKLGEALGGLDENNEPSSSNKSLWSQKLFEKFLTYSASAASISETCQLIKLLINTACRF